MIIGIGIDLCEISRMGESIKSPSFLQRFFSAEECEYISPVERAVRLPQPGALRQKKPLQKRSVPDLPAFLCVMSL